jgi:hypothetical protein
VYEAWRQAGLKQGFRSLIVRGDAISPVPGRSLPRSIRRKGRESAISMNQEEQDSLKELYHAGQRAVIELGLDDTESELQNLAIYLHALERENDALRTRLNALRQPVAAMA